MAEMKITRTRIWNASLLLGAASALAIGMSQPVIAQDATPTVRSDETITVTATRRETNLQDTAAAVAVLTDGAIATRGIEDIAEIDIFVPGLEIDDLDITQPTFTIRGVNTADFGIGTEPSVGVFVDGIYTARSGAALSFLTDVKRIEVLKGPQGTLFGRNTSAGAISIITNEPNVDEFETFGTLRLGNYNKRRFEGTVNVPIIENKLAVRVNGLVNQRDGIVEDDVTGEDGEFESNYAFRVSVGWQPTENTEVIARWLYDEVNKNGPTAIGIGPFALSRSFDGPYTNDVLESHENRNLNSANVTVTHDFSDTLTFTGIASYVSFETLNRQDEDGTAELSRYFDTENREENESYYIEGRVNGEWNRFNYVAGVSWFKEDGFQNTWATAFTDSVDSALNQVAGFPIFTILNQVGGLPVFGIRWDEDVRNYADNTSIAAFTDVQYSITDRMRFTAGLRYTRDKKEFTWFNGPRRAEELDAITAPGSLYNAILGAPLFPDVPIDVNTFYNAVIGGDLNFTFGAFEGVPFTREETFEDFSPRFVIDYDLTEDIFLFASAANGYKAGGFNSVELNSFFEDESVWNYEIGAKTQWLDGDLTINGSIYYLDYRNRQQISLEGTTTSGVPQFVTTSGDSEAFGADLDIFWTLSDQLSVFLSTGVIDSKWDTRTERGVDISGQPTGEPVARIVAGFDYIHPLPNDLGSLTLHMDNSYTTARRENDATAVADAEIAPFTPASQFDEVRDARNITNARLTWNPADNDHFAVSAYVENLFDDQRPRDINDLTAATLGTPYSRIGEPRLYGVDLSFRF